MKTLTKERIDEDLDTQMLRSRMSSIFYKQKYRQKWIFEGVLYVLGIESGVLLVYFIINLLTNG
jgi:hypothetical protein